MLTLKNEEEKMINKKSIFLSTELNNKKNELYMMTDKKIKT